MAMSRDYLEAILWPRYRDASANLCQALWALANPKQSAVKSPVWFDEIVEVQLKSVLMMVFSTPQTWIILPEPLPGFTVVVCKRQARSSGDATQQRLNLRNHSFDQFSDLSQLVEKAAVKLLRKTIGSGTGDVIELENEDGHVFVFPRPKMKEYLMALGFAEDQVPKLLSIDDIEGF